MHDRYRQKKGRPSQYWANPSLKWKPSDVFWDISVIPVLHL